MASIFDSPLFWIIAVWWLLSTLLGAKARRRRAMQAQAAPPAQPAVPFRAPQPEGELEPSPVGERPGEIEVEGEALEAQPLTSAPEPQEYPGRESPEPPSRPISRLEDLFRGLGLAEEMLPTGLRPDREALPPEEPGPEPEEAPPEELLPIEPATATAEEYLPPQPRGYYTLLAETTLARLTHLQQAVVLKEVLDRPRAQRRAIR